MTKLGTGRWMGTGGLLLVGVIAVLVAPAAPTNAQPGTSYSAVAEARVAGLNYTFAPGVLFEQLVDGGSSVAQAELSSLGDSRAFAADPYPSESVVLLPGLLAGLTEGSTSGVVPEYPLYASSSHPTRSSSRVAAGSVVLEATSDAEASVGSSANGVNIGTADVRVDPATGAVTATAAARAGTVRLSDLLVLNGIESTATARRLPGGEIQLTSTFDAGSISIAGQRFGLDALLGEDQGGIPALVSSVGSQLLEQLAGDGTRLDIVPAERSADSITSAALRVTMVTGLPDLPDPPPLPDPDLPAAPGLPLIFSLPGGLSGIESITTEILLGQTRARVDSRALPSFATGAFDPPSADIGLQSGPDLASGVRPTAPSSTVHAPTTGAGVPSEPAASFDPALAIAANISVERFYPVLILAAAVLVGVTTLVRKLGVRDP